MRYLSLLEKIKLLFNELMSFKFVFAALILIVIFTILYMFKKINNKKYIITISLLIISTLIISIVTNTKILSDTFDNFMTIFFSGIYFPSIYIYISAFLVVAIMFTASLINSKIKKIYRVISSIAFIINNLFFIIILNIIAKNNIDIFNISSLYTNNSLVAILELNMEIFILWIFAMTVAYITNSICDKITMKKQEKIVSNEVFTTDNIVKIKEEVPPISVNNKLHNKVALANTVEKELDIKKDNNVTFNDILNELVPVKYYDNEVVNASYDLANPQKVYESKYNNLKKELESNTLINETKNITDEKEVRLYSNNYKEEKTKNNLELSLNDLINDSKKVEIIPHHNIEKEEKVKNNLINNTISLNDLIKDKQEVITEIEGKQEIKDEIEDNKIVNESSYTLNDYKKIIEMLKSIKSNSSQNNITLDDALTMSLINNYSIDDCIKLKEILESSLN